MSGPTRPVLRWHGGKWLLAPWILSHFPPHRVYVEAFGGAASVLLQKDPLPGEVYNDLDGTVVNVFRVLRDPLASAELQRRLSLTLFARTEFDWTYEPAVDDLDRAHKTIVRSFMGHGSDSASRSCRTGFRSRLTDERAFAAQSWATYACALPLFTRRLLGTVIEQRPALEVIARTDTPQTLFYLDPPYPHATRSSLTSRSKRTHGYAHELTDADHAELLDAVLAVRGMVVISSYPNELYDNALRSWRRAERSALADGGRERTEVLWINPAGAAALDQSCGLFFFEAAE